MPPPNPDDPYYDGCFQRKPGSRYNIYPATASPTPFPAGLAIKYCTRCSQPVSYDSQLELHGRTENTIDNSSNSDTVALASKFESHQALERAVSNARLGPNAFKALPVGRTRPPAPSSGSHSRRISNSSFTKTHQTYRPDLYGNTTSPIHLTASSSSASLSSALRTSLVSAPVETPDLRYQLRLVFRHASKHESKRFQAIQGSEILILEPAILEQVISGEYAGWTKFLTLHLLSQSWLWQEFVKLIPYDQSKDVNQPFIERISFFLSWTATGGGIRIPEREYQIPTTLRKILCKYFPHTLGTAKRSSKPPPDPTIFLALEYTLLFDPEEDPIPPSHLGRKVKVQDPIENEDYVSQFSDLDNNRKSVKVVYQPYTPSAPANPSPTGEASFTATIHNTATTCFDQSNLRIDPYLINIDHEPEKQLQNNRHLNTAQSMEALALGLADQINVRPQPSTPIILVDDSPLSTPPRSPPSSPPLPQVGKDLIFKRSRAQITSSSPSRPHSHGSPALKRTRSQTKALNPKC